MKLKYNVQTSKYKNIKEVLKNYFHISNRLLIRLKNNQCIYLNNSLASINSTINIDDMITVDISFNEKSNNIHPIKMDLDIIFEDDALLIVNKPFGMPVHPSMQHFEDSLSNGIQYYYEQNAIFTKIRPVNRLDKDTSGIVIFAKNEYIQECLINQMKNNIFQKKYIALLEGNINNKIGIINEPISRKEGSIIEREINPNGQNAITKYKVIKNYSEYCLVEFELETGRTHQIRVHSKYIGHPILSDDLYGNKSTLISRQALHAYKVSFIHPITNKNINLTANIPEDILNLI